MALFVCLRTKLQFGTMWIKSAIEQDLFSPKSVSFMTWNRGLWEGWSEIEFFCVNEENKCHWFEESLPTKRRSSQLVKMGVCTLQWDVGRDVWSRPYCSVTQRRRGRPWDKLPCTVQGMSRRENAKRRNFASESQTGLRFSYTDVFEMRSQRIRLFHTQMCGIAGFVLYNQTLRMHTVHEYRGKAPMTPNHKETNIFETRMALFFRRYSCLYESKSFVLALRR